MFNMTNPLWTYLIMPSLFIGIGVVLGICISAWVTGILEKIDRGQSEETGFEPISHVRSIPRRPFDQDVD